MQFGEILGQARLKEKLIDTVKNGRISHAQLFCGKSGFGTFPLAIAYIQYISCTNKQEQDSCGECSNCMKFSKLSHPDLHFALPVSTTKKIKSNATTKDFITQWRELVDEQTYFEINDWYSKIELENKQGFIGVKECSDILKKLSLKAYEGGHKFLIIWQADKLNIDASNKLLKLIEEPPKKTILILISDKPDLLLKTITSRTQMVNVGPIENNLLSEKLQSLGATKELAEKITLSTGGDFIQAKKQLLANDESIEFFELFKKWMRVCWKVEIQEINAWVEQVCKSDFGREKQKRFIEYAIKIMREGLMKNYLGSGLQTMYGEEALFMKNFAPFVHSNNILPMSEILNEAHYHISRNAYGKILFMDLSMKFANMLHIKNVHL